MTDTLRQLTYGNDLTLKEQADAIDDLLDLYVGMLSDLFPDVPLWRSGSVLYNKFSIGADAGVKVQLLSRKNLYENIEKCSNCGRQLPNDVLPWVYEDFIRGAKEALKKQRKINKRD